MVPDVLIVGLYFLSKSFWGGFVGEEGVDIFELFEIFGFGDIDI